MTDYRLEEVPSEEYLEVIDEYCSDIEDSDFRSELEREYDSRKLDPEEETIRPSGAGGLGGLVAGASTGMYAVSGQPEEYIALLSVGALGALIGEEAEYQLIKYKLED